MWTTTLPQTVGLYWAENEHGVELIHIKQINSPSVIFYKVLYPDTSNYGFWNSEHPYRRFLAVTEPVLDSTSV